MDIVRAHNRNNNNNRCLKSRVRSHHLARCSKSHRQTFSSRNNPSNHLKCLRGGLSKSRFHQFGQRAHTNLRRSICNNAKQDVNNSYTNNGNKSESEIYAGTFTREVYNAICCRLGDKGTIHIPEDSIQALFNDMELYPSKTQVAKMLQCARQCTRRNGASAYLTFGEFCVFVREMQNLQNQTSKQARKTSLPKTNSKCTRDCEVFLGGSCNPTTWRADTAIPELQKQGITFYNPQVSIWRPELVAREHDAKQAASVLFFVIDSQTRSTVGMTEVAYLVASGRCVVVVAQPYKEGQSIMGEIISDREYEDLVNAQNSLLTLVKSRGVKIHSNLPTALQCTANILRSHSSAEDQLTYKLRKLREVYDSYGGEMKLNDIFEAYEKLTNRSLDINKFYRSFGPSQDSNSTISFERFCTLMAEVSTDGCDMCTNDVWATQPIQRQVAMNNNSCNINTTFIEVLHDSTSSNTPNDSSNNQSTYDIYLGGSTKSEIKWRRDIAIPLLKKHGVSYYNPAIREEVNDFDKELKSVYINSGRGSSSDDDLDSLDVLECKNVVDQSNVLLFVITNDTRSMTTMVLVSHYIGLGKNIVLCIQQLPTEECIVHNEVLTKNAIKDYNRARVYVEDLAKRKEIPVFENITEAVECAMGKCQNR